MLLKDYQAHIGFLECMPASTKVGARLELSEDISEVLPYLNGRVEDGYLDRSGGCLQFNRERLLVTVQSKRIAMASFEDHQEAEEAVAWIVGLINDTWEERDRLTPLYQSKPKPPVLEVLRHLPRTNCGDCNQPSCMAFAVLLIDGKAAALNCPMLGEPDWAGQRARLELMLGKEAVAERGDRP